MTDIVEPDEDLWKWVVQNGGQARDVLWPPDSETAVRDLGAAWSSSAKALKDAIDGSGNVAKALERTWPDAAGFELRYVIDSLNNGSLGEAGLKELVTAMESLGLACQDYANKVQGAKYQIRAYISRNIKAFAACTSWAARTVFAISVAQQITALVAALADQVGKAPVETAKPPAKPEPPHGFWGNVGAFFVGIGEGAVDMVKGFAGLVGLGEDWHFSWSTLGQSWGGLGKFALAAVTYGTPGLSAIDQSVGLPFFQRGEMGETLTEAGKVMIAYDLWSEDPARAAGKTTFNIASAVLGTKGAGAAIRGAGAAVKGSKVGAVATAGRIVEQAGTAITKIPTVSEVAVQAAKRLPGLLDTLRGVDRFEHGSPGTSPHVIDTPPPHQPPNTSETRPPGQPPKDLPDRVPPEQSPNRAPHEPPRPPTEHPPKSGSVGEAMDPHRSPTGQPHTSGGERPHESGARDPHAGGSPRGDHQSHEPAKSPAHQEQPKQSEAGRHGEPSQRLEAAGRPEQASHLEAAKSPEPAGHHEAAENPESSKHQEQHGESVSSAGRPTARLDPETGRFQLSDEIPAHETREQVVLREEEIVRKAQEEWAESKPVQPQTPTQTVIYAVTRALGLTHTMDDFAHGVHITPSSEPSTPHPTREPVPKDREKTVPDEEAAAKPPLKLGDPGLPPLHAPGNSVAHVDLAAGKVGRIDPPEPPSPPRSPKPEPPDPVPPKPKPESAAAGSPHSPKPENWSPEPRPENELPGPRPENRLPDPRPENRLPEQRPENRLPEPRSENRLPDPRPENRLPDLAKEPELSAGRPTVQFDPETGEFHVPDDVSPDQMRETVGLREEETVRKAQEEWAEKKAVEPQMPTQTAIYTVTRALGLTHIADDFAHGVHVTPSSEPPKPHPTREPVSNDHEKTSPGEESSPNPKTGLPPRHDPGNSVVHIDPIVGKAGHLDSPGTPAPPHLPNLESAAPESPHAPKPDPHPENRPLGSPHEPATQVPTADRIHSAIHPESNGAHHAPEGGPHEHDPGRPEHHQGPRDRPGDHGSEHGQPEYLTSDEVNQRHSESTPAGSSYHRADADMGDLPHRVLPDPDGRYTVDVHVTPEGHARIGDRRYTPEEFADILRRNGDYDGRPIRLIGCDAGSNDFAKRLSRELDTEVMAPSKPAWTDSNGRVFSSDYEIGPDGKMRPRIPPNGEWDVHSPDGSARRASEDGFTPDTPETDKHDLDVDSSRDRGDGDNDNDDYDTSGWDQHEIGADDPRRSERAFVDYDRPGHDQPDATSPANPYNRPPESPHPTITVGPRRRDTTPPGDFSGEVRTVPKVLDGVELMANTEYHVRNVGKNGEVASETRFFTDGDGKIKWVECTPGRGRLSDGSLAQANPDFNYPLLPDTQYRVDNYNDPSKKFDYQTDSKGRSQDMTGQPEYRDSNKDYRDEGGQFSGQGRAGHEGQAAYRADPEHKDASWAGGHFAANESGGPPGYGNMHPQMSASNSGTGIDGWDPGETWRRTEQQLAAFHNPPERVVEILQVHAPRRADGVPPHEVMRWQVSEVDPGTGQRVTRVFERVFPTLPEDIDFGLPVRRYGQP